MQDNKTNANLIINNLLDKIKTMSLHIAILETQNQELLKLKSTTLQTEKDTELISNDKTTL